MNACNAGFRVQRLGLGGLRSRAVSGPWAWHREKKPIIRKTPHLATSTAVNKGSFTVLRHTIQQVYQAVLRNTVSFRPLHNKKVTPKNTIINCLRPYMTGPRISSAVALSSLCPRRGCRELGLDFWPTAPRERVYCRGKCLL